MTVPDAASPGPDMAHARTPVKGPLPTIYHYQIRSRCAIISYFSRRRWYTIRSWRATGADVTRRGRRRQLEMEHVRTAVGPPMWWLLLIAATVWRSRRNRCWAAWPTCSEQSSDFHSLVSRSSKSVFFLLRPAAAEGADQVLTTENFVSSVVRAVLLLSDMQLHCFISE